jgi:hypothetical protein
MEIQVINSDALKQALLDRDCNRPFAEIGSEHFQIPYSEITPPPDYVKRENFPHGFNLYNEVYLNAQKQLEAFPNCCKEHSKLNGQPWFNKSDYAQLPEKLVNQLSYTECHIVNQIDTPDWYKEITDYIFYNVSSFGQLPDGYGSPVGLQYYLTVLEHWLKNAKHGIPKEKKIRLIEYLNQYDTRETTTGKADLNILYSTYKKWLKTFPFHISYFAQIKESLEKKLPFVSGEKSYNKYLQAYSFKVQTQSGLIDALIAGTKHILNTINSAELIKTGQITDKNAHRLDLVNETHRIKQTALLGEFTTKEIRYITILKQWLNNEKAYFAEIAPLIKEVSDNDFITGLIKLEFTPQGASGYFEVIKDQSKRKYTPEQLFNLELQNWETAIDNANTKEEKLLLTNKAIFTFRKDWLTYTHPLIESLKEKTVLHLQHIAEYISSTPASAATQPTNAETKTEKIKAHLLEYGFFDLPTVKPLTDVSKQKLIDLISANALPYKVAMLEYLGFIKYLERERITTKYKMYRTVSNWLEADKDGRTIRGLLNSLLPRKEKANARYTAYLHKEQVKKDYLLLK